MGQFLLQAVYKPEALQALARNPQNRVEVIRQLIEKLGGKLVAGGLIFGDFEPELVAICELPDNICAAALALAINVGGLVKALKTTPMISGEEGLEAFSRAANAGYRPPGL